MLISFTCIIVASMGIATAYSLEHHIAYLFGYASSVFFLVFVAVACCYAALSNRIVGDFAKECGTRSGIAFQVDKIYEEGTSSISMLCSDACPCAVEAGSGLDLSTLTTSPNGSSRYLQCEAETLSVHKEYRFAPILYLLEKEFDCAGICEEPGFMLFTTPKSPKQLCRDTIVSLV